MKRAWLMGAHRLLLAGVALLGCASSDDDGESSAQAVVHPVAPDTPEERALSQLRGRTLTLLQPIRFAKGTLDGKPSLFAPNDPTQCRLELLKADNTTDLAENDQPGIPNTKYVIVGAGTMSTFSGKPNLSFSLTENGKPALVRLYCENLQLTDDDSQRPSVKAINFAEHLKWPRPHVAELSDTPIAR